MAPIHSYAHLDFSFGLQMIVKNAIPVRSENWVKTTLGENKKEILFAKFTNISFRNCLNLSSEE